MYSKADKHAQLVYDHIIPVDRIVNHSPANLFLMKRPDLISTFTKIALWKQIQFDKLVYLDADTVTLRAPDELFDTPSTFAAVPDIGWPDCFNTGVLVLSPNMGDYYALLALAQRGISFDGADQGLLNMHFTNWHRLSFTNNCTPSGNYQYLPAYRHFQSTISVVHYIGVSKPWQMGRESTASSGAYSELLGRWWAVYDKHFRQSTGSRSAVTRHVKGEVSEHAFVYSTREEPEARYITTEPSLASPSLPAEQPPAPLPTAQQRKFSIDWDPVHQPPPLASRPEAADFPTITYTMSSSSALFQPPSSYPPTSNNQQSQAVQGPSTPKPQPLFPWESSQAKPTRVFADDTPTLTPSAPNATPSVTTDTDTLTETQSPTTPLSPPGMEPFSTYQRTNAWDEIPEIESYLLAQQQQRNPKFSRSQPSASSNVPPSGDTAAAVPSSTTEDIISPTSDIPPSSSDPSFLNLNPRRPSMKLTDFPTAFERPSLPVTPAPAPRRPSFWGTDAERADGSEGPEGVDTPTTTIRKDPDPAPASTASTTTAPTNPLDNPPSSTLLFLPSAEGVPQQQEEWDPVKKLEELQRRQSAVLEGGVAEKLVNVRVGGGGDGVRVGGQGGDGGVPRREVVRSSVDDGDDGQVGERGRGREGG